MKLREGGLNMLFIIFICVLMCIACPPLTLLFLPTAVIFIVVSVASQTKLDEHGCVKREDNDKHSWER